MEFALLAAIPVSVYIAQFSQFVRSVNYILKEFLHVLNYEWQASGSGCALNCRL